MPEINEASDLESVLITNRYTAQFRNIHADGVSGGITHNDILYMQFFADKMATADQIGYKMYPDGHGEQIPELTKGTPGVVRDIEVGVYMNKANLRVFAQWILQRLAEFEGNSIPFPETQESSE